jgi:hypothetical protein
MFVVPSVERRLYYFYFVVYWYFYEIFDDCSVSYFLKIEEQNFISLLFAGGVLLTIFLGGVRLVLINGRICFGVFGGENGLLNVIACYWVVILTKYFLVVALLLSLGDELW